MQVTKKPHWLKVKLPSGQNFKELRSIVETHQLHTICSSGRCPNMGECWGDRTATFMILGNICTRSCGFCNVKTGKPLPVDQKEPERIARSIQLMGVKHAVITSVDRDDLLDGGAEIWAETIRKVRELNPGVTMETLIPDFQANEHLLDIIVKEKPEVVSHNLETVQRLTKQVRKQAKYDRSLYVLKYLKEAGINRTKSGIMLGLGETIDEVIETMKDLRNVGVDVMTIGQYLQPSPNHLPVDRFPHPDEFNHLEKIGLELGFRFVESGPLVRSSYHAHKHIL
jgi:lipoic acid synthetase